MVLRQISGFGFLDDPSRGSFPPPKREVPLTSSLGMLTLSDLLLIDERSGEVTHPSLLTLLLTPLS